MAEFCAGDWASPHEVADPGNQASWPQSCYPRVLGRRASFACHPRHCNERTGNYWQSYSAWREALSGDFARMESKEHSPVLSNICRNITGAFKTRRLVQRSLGRMAKHYDQHLGPLQQDCDAFRLASGYVDGPQQIEDLAKRSIINEDAASRNVFWDPLRLALAPREKVQPLQTTNSVKIMGKRSWPKNMAQLALCDGHKAHLQT